MALNSVQIHAMAKLTSMECATFQLTHCLQTNVFHSLDHFFCENQQHSHILNINTTEARRRFHWLHIAQINIITNLIHKICTTNSRLRRHKANKIRSKTLKSIVDQLTKNRRIKTRFRLKQHVEMIEESWESFNVWHVRVASNCRCIHWNHSTITEIRKSTSSFVCLSKFGPQSCWITLKKLLQIINHSV